LCGRSEKKYLGKRKSFSAKGCPESGREKVRNDARPNGKKKLKGNDAIRRDKEKRKEKPYRKIISSIFKTRFSPFEMPQNPSTQERGSNNSR